MDIVPDDVRDGSVREHLLATLIKKEEQIELDPEPHLKAPLHMHNTHFFETEVDKSMKETIQLAGQLVRAEERIVKLESENKELISRLKERN